MRKWYPLIAVAVVLAASAAAYPRLPDSIPTSWTMRGEPDGYGSKEIGLFVMPLIMLGIWGLLRTLPRIDPRGENYAKMRGAYDLVVNSILTFMGAIHLAGIAALLGAPIPLERLVPAMICVVLIVMGNVLPQARPNWFFGIRTPWTLSSDRVWERTHRFGGHLMVLCGVVGLAAAALPLRIATPALTTLGLIAAIGSIIYSYVAWRQERLSGGAKK